MRCPSCGGDIRIQDKVCPYCGMPNQEFLKHQEAMQHYEKEFEKTKTDVYQETEKTKRFSGRVLVIAGLVVANVLALLLVFNSYNIVDMFRTSAINAKLSTYQSGMDKLLEDGDYVGVYEYYYANDLYSADGLRNYSSVMDVAGDYVAVLRGINKMIIAEADQKEKDEYDDPAEYVANNLESYFSVSSASYFVDEARMKEGHEEYVADMQEQIRQMTKTYCHITDEDWESFKFMSKAGIQKILEERAA
ncbi:MAG: zinc ribbon domain-containing protein [Lachnospiraceae bacterium]|nr:zinc ribbon domain-containing protein [Lachnospiraceae bacterium]